MQGLSPEAAAHALKAVSLPDIRKPEDLEEQMGLTADQIRVICLIPRAALLRWLAGNGEDSA